MSKKDHETKHDRHDEREAGLKTSHKETRNKEGRFEGYKHSSEAKHSREEHKSRHGEHGLEEEKRLAKATNNNTDYNCPAGKPRNHGTGSFGK